MATLVNALIITSLLMSIVILILALTSSLLAKKIPSNWRYYIWLIVIIGLLIPFRFDFQQVPQVEITATEVVQDSTQKEETMVTQSSQKLEDTIDSEAQNSNKINWKTIICCIWLAGVVIFLGFHLWKNYHFNKLIKRWGKPIEDPKILSAFKNAKELVGVEEKTIELKACKFVSSPMLVGLIKPNVLLPDQEIPQDELELILRHELTHYRRKDLWYKALIILTTIIHWFNPIVYLMSHAIQADCESSCDEAVLQNTQMKDRRLYGEAIIGFIGRKPSLSTAFSTYFYGGKKTMKNRLVSIMDNRKKSTLIAAFCMVVVMAVTVISGATVFAENNNFNNSTILSSISADEAQDIALEKTGGGTVIKCEQDDENGIQVYKIEIINGAEKYSMSIGMLNSKIYNFKQEIIEVQSETENIISEDEPTQQAAIDSSSKSSDNHSTSSSNNNTNSNSNSSNTNNNTSTSNNNTSNSNNNTTNNNTISTSGEISAAKAQEIALARTGGGTVVKCELDYEDDIKVYEIEIINGSIEYSMDVDAITGAIYDFESETVDD